MPKLSIITPNYNYARFIGQALDSVLEQEYEDYEHIVMDDGSTDESWEIIQDYIRLNPKAYAIRNKENLGVADSFKRLLRESTGEYIYGFSSDDVLMPGALSRAMSLADAHPEAGVILGKMVCIDQESRQLATLQSKKWQASGYYHPESFFIDFICAESATFSLGTTAIYRKDKVVEIGRPHTQLISWSDTFAIWTIGQLTGICYVNELQAAWRKHDQAFSVCANKSIEDVCNLVFEAVRLMSSEDFYSLYPVWFVNKWSAEFLLRRYGEILKNSVATQKTAGRLQTFLAIKDMLDSERGRLLIHPNNRTQFLSVWKAELSQVTQSTS